MKRFILPLLAALLLCGCHSQAKETTAQTTVAAAPSTPIQSLYDPNSTIEEQTQGAVTAFSLAGHSVTGIRFFGEQLLVFTMDEHVELTTVLLLQGTQPGIAQRLTLDCALYADEVTVSTDGQTLAYYNPLENSVVLLDRTLAQTRRIQLPDQVTEQPVLTADLQTLYYSAGNEIYALDMETGLSRLLKQHNCASQSLSALHFDDTVLEVFLTQESGESLVAFISTESGETIGSDKALLTLTSQGAHYLLQRLDGTVTETLVGSLGGTIASMDRAAAEAVYPAFSMNALAGVLGSRLRLYDLDTGTVRAETDLGKQVLVLDAFPDPSAQLLWLRVVDQLTDTPLLLRWDVSACEVSQSEVFLHQRYTAADPDTQGLARCQEQADTFTQAYGMTVLIGGELPLPQGYSCVTEYQPSALEDGLAQLEQALSAFPQAFLAGLGTVNQSGTVHIALVRDILDISGSSVSDTGGLHYVSAGDHYILLTAGPELETAFLHQLCHVLDAYVYAHCPDYDLWDGLNPKGFAYSGSYAVEAAPDDPNLQGDTQCFVSAYSLSFAREDRAELFVAAMEPGNEALLAIPGLQSKLRYMCDAIRQAYGWEETELSLPWEQYLTEE